MLLQLVFRQFFQYHDMEGAWVGRRGWVGRELKGGESNHSNANSSAVPSGSDQDLNKSQDRPSLL